MKKIKVKKILIYIISLLVIINCRSIYVHTITNNISNYIYVALIMCEIYYILLTKIYKDIFTNSLINITIYYFLIIIYILFGDISNGSATFCIRFLIILPITYLMFIAMPQKEVFDFFKAFVNIVVILAYISLFFYLFGTILNLIKSSGIIQYEWGEISNAPNYYYIYFNTQNSYFMGNILKRNTGIFTEAPMYSLILSIALAISYYITDERKIKKIVILITIVSTLSITGIVISIIIYLLNYILNNKIKLKYILAPILFIIGFIGIQYFIKDKQDTMSYFTRIDDFIAGFKAWKENPIIGNGFLNDSVVLKYMNKARIYNTGIASSLVIVATQGGLCMLMIYVYPIVKSIIKSIKIKKYKIVCFSAIMSLLFITTAFQYTILAIIFIAIGLSYNKNWIE